MYKIREFKDTDIEFVMTYSFILGLEIREHADYETSNAFTVIDEQDEIIGVGIVGYHSSWYCEMPDTVHKLVLEYCIMPGKEESLPTLISGAKAVYQRLQKDNPHKNMKLIYYTRSDDFNKVQQFLNNDFCFNQLIPVLKYDLSHIVHYTVPKEVTIKALPLNEESVQQYIRATAQANEGIADSIGEFWFRAQDESFKAFAAYVGKEVVGGISIWNMGETGGATESIFVVPDYRRKNIASELIATALEEFKQRGKQEVMLSMNGDNGKAMRLYQKLGYELMFYLVELGQVEST